MLWAVSRRHLSNLTMVFVNLELKLSLRRDLPAFCPTSALGTAISWYFERVSPGDNDCGKTVRGWSDCKSDFKI